jgi:hypothetical protein
VLQTFFEVFGYRGQWRLEIKRHRGERADHDAVYLMQYANFLDDAIVQRFGGKRHGDN